MEYTEKRKRSSNFTKTEVRLLSELIPKYTEFIDNKKNDSVSNKNKEDAWNKITSAFNSVTRETPRSVKTLKLKYEGIKKQMKKRARMCGNDDEPTAADFDDVEKVLAVLSSNKHGFDDPNESIPRMTSETNSIPESVIKVEMVMVNRNETDDDASLNQNSSPNTAGSTNGSENNEDSSSQWDFKGKRSLMAKQDELISEQLDLVRLQRQIALKEHELKMQHLRNEEARKDELHKLMLSALHRKQV